jgi:hypothetical protein
LTHLKLRFRLLITMISAGLYGWYNLLTALVVSTWIVVMVSNESRNYWISKDAGQNPLKSIGQAISACVYVCVLVCVSDIPVELRLLQ